MALLDVLGHDLFASGYLRHQRDPYIAVDPTRPANAPEPQFAAPGTGAAID